VPGKISATTWKVEILLTLETKLLSFICTLVTGHSSYHESVYFWWWVVCVHADVIGPQNLLYW
jgi:hypothetical protein